MLGAAGAGASAAALLALRAGALVEGCDPGGPGPYTAALEAAGLPLAWAHDAAHVEGSPPPHRLAVTKALTAIAPDHPELEAARRRGIPLEAWQQVVADAAVGRTLVGVAGTHGKSTTSGWLVHLLVSAGLDPSAFVGALLPADITGGPPATARWGRGGAFVVEADEYAGNFDPYAPAVAVVTSAEWDHPDVFADRAAVVSAFETWLRRAAAQHPQPILVANIADAGVAELVTALRDWPGRVIATALVDQAPQRPGGYAREMAEQFATAAGPARTLLGRVDGRGAGRHDPRAPRPRPTRRAGCGPALDRRPPQRGERARGRRSGARPRGRRRRHRARARILRGRRPAAGAEGRAAGRRRLRRLRPPPHGDPRDSRRRSPAGTRPPNLGGLRAADVPSDRRPDRRVRGRPRHRGRRGDRGHLGGPGPGHDGRVGRGARRGRRSPSAGPAGRRTGNGRGDRGLAGRRSPAGRRRPRDGRRPKLPDRRAVAGCGSRDTDGPQAESTEDHDRWPVRSRSTS